MENIYLDHIRSHQHKLGKITRAHYQPSSNGLLLVHQLFITKYAYSSKQQQFEHIFTFGPIEELGNEIVLLEELVEQENVLIATEDGSIFTIDKKGEVDVKAQNQDGITAASVSPTQEYLYIVTKNKSLIQLNAEFDLINEIVLDENEEVVDSRPQFSWRADGNYFMLNYETVNGHKAVTKDIMMVTFISPSKSDPNEEGLVQSVSEKGRPKMKGLVAWQPTGSIAAGIDYILEGQSKELRVIFWQKNGLRHLQFKLPKTVMDVVEMFWSSDSAILFLKVKHEDGRNEILLYYRSNYHWFLKNSVPLLPADLCLSLFSQKQKHHILIVQQDKFELLEYSIRLPEKQWKSEQCEISFKNQFFYFVDGGVISITDLSKCLMPPPMSMIKADFGSKVRAVAKKRDHLLVITEEQVQLYNVSKQTVVDSCDLGAFKDRLFPSLKLLSNQCINFVAGSKRYSKSESVLKLEGDYHCQDQSYQIISADQKINLTVSYQNQQLTVNNNLLSQQCTSFTLYHQFLLFTVSTSQMYDKLYVINLTLDKWVYEEDQKIKNRLADLETKDLLNHRLVERGSRIVTISEGRVVFQLPRGNLEGIYPKIIMINLVKKKIESKEYRQAFEIIRTHKLDFNLIYDINPQQFELQIDRILTDIKRVDYINLLIAQITETASTELQYILSSKAYQGFKNDFELSLKGKKVKTVCRMISQSLRNLSKQDFILPIYTSEIREGKLNDVLFQIKEMKKNEIQVVVPPHIIQGQKKEKKRATAQQVLEYVCWLVDANAIYEAALLTYDLELAAITARCTQKDPKQYIPYFQSLKEIKDPVQFRSTICLDLKKYQIAVRQLSEGNVEQKNSCLDLIKKHKLFKQGLIIFEGKAELYKVKEFIIDELLNGGEVNQAYRIAQSIGLHERAFQIARGVMQTQKIIECLEIIYQNREEREKQALKIIEQIKDEIKNRTDLARLYAYVGKFEEAASLYLRYNEYKKAYEYLWKVSSQFRSKEMKEGFKICFSVKRNDIVRDKKEFIEKYARLKKVQKNKAEFGEPTTFKPRQNDDMYSEVSVASKAQSSYTISTVTGMRKKKDKKRSILTRNVKQGSPIEQQYLLAYLKMLQDKVDDAVKDAKILIQHLIYMNLIQEAELMRNEVRDYLEVFTTYPVKSFAKGKFEQIHPQAGELYFQPSKIAALSIDSFNYLF